MKMNNIKTNLICITLLFVTAIHIHAELPYESNHTNSIVATSGVHDSYVSSKYDHNFNISYIYNNNIIVGISHRNNFHNPHVSLDAITLASIGSDPFLLELSKPHRHNYLNVYTLINLDKFLLLKTPISFSLFAGFQDLKEERNFVGNFFIYKNIRLNRKHSIQPLIAVGYRNININSSGGYRNFDAGFIYYNRLNDSFQFTATPLLNRYFERNIYSIQIGLMFGYK